MDTGGKFFLGKLVDDSEVKTTLQPLLYDPADLTTHAVVVGMTGSGKTGLCIDLLEEAALNGVPALMIDPKGDITNSLLHFPDLLPQDFLPWINPDQARREGKTIEQAAQETARTWQQGLADWDLAPERLSALKNAAQFTIYTPGSDSGIPISILASLKAPLIPWLENRELLREKISGTVVALLGLVGLSDIDPVRSREHILLANIFENAWSKGKNLDLGELILQTQNPPFQKLGVFDVNTFYPEKDRFSLAMQLNNILASPSFQSWIEGQPLDIPSFLTAPDGRPRHSVFYIAHLSEMERMFFVTLLFSAVEAWMRSQPGSTTLRSIVYFDEIFGYMPPVGNPPSKMLMLRMLKQARAFGVGLVLVTQNPVDIDYKALSNAGTWFIGKLQTEQDKARLLDGLESAMAGGLNRSEYDRLISRLGKRVFLLQDVHQKHPVPFQTRWAMNYLAGPLTRTQIAVANDLTAAGLPAQSYAQADVRRVDAAVSPSTPSPDVLQAVPLNIAAAIPAAFDSLSKVDTPQSEPGSSTRPVVPAAVVEYFLPNNITFSQAFQAAGQPYPDEAFSQGLLYKPVILTQVVVRFLNRKYNLDHEMYKAALVQAPDRRGAIRWEDHLCARIDTSILDSSPVPQVRYTALEAPFVDARLMSAVEKDFLDWVYRTTKVAVRAHEGLKMYAGPEISPAEFRTTCTESARKQRDLEIKKTADKFDSKINIVQNQLLRETRELSEDQTELSQRKIEELGTHAENVLGLFNRRSQRRLSTSLTKRRLTEQAKADVQESLEAIDNYKRQLKELEAEKAQALDEINRRWGEMAIEITEIHVAPYKKDIMTDLFGVAWMPFYLIRAGNNLLELPGYQVER
jgi:hypothetical protein